METSNYIEELRILKESLAKINNLNNLNGTTNGNNTSINYVPQQSQVISTDIYQQSSPGKLWDVFKQKHSRRGYFNHSMSGHTYSGTSYDPPIESPICLNLNNL